VALDAFNRFVPPFKSESCPVVVKIGSRPERAREMAFGTGCSKGTPVVVCMTAHTFRVQPEVGKPFSPDFGGANVRRLMAASAILRPVSAGKRKTGQAVVELLRIEPDDPEVRSMMIAVAAHTAFSTDLRGCMISPLCTDARF
jgi:hypothetical protein